MKRAAEGVGPYGADWKCGANAPGNGNLINVFRRVVEDAEPYDGGIPVGRDAHIAPGEAV